MALQTLAPRTPPGRSTRDRCRVAVVWLACFAPLAWIPGGANMWVFGKALIFAIAIAIALLIGMRGAIPRGFVQIGWAGVIAVLLSASVNGSTLAGLVGRAPRYEGLPMLALYGAIFWLGTTLSPGSRARHALPEALTAASVTLGVASVAGLLGHNPLGTFVQVRDGSLVGNATDQGLVGLVFLAALASPAWTRRDPLLGLGVAAAVITIAASGSRAAMLGTLAAAVVVVVLTGKRAWPVAAAASGTLAVAVLAVPATRERLTSSFSLDARWQGWMMTLDMIRDHPVLGVGLGNYMDTIGRYETFTWARTAGAENTIINSPHSWPLQFVAAAGAIGALLAIAFVALAIKQLRAALRSPAADDLTVGLAAASVGFGSGLLVNFTIIGSAGVALFLFGAALAPSPITHQTHRRNHQLQRRATAATAVVGVVVIGAACVAELFVSLGSTAMKSGDVEHGASAYQAAHWLRPYDADVRSDVALWLSGSRDRARRTVGRELAESALTQIPRSYRARLALAGYRNDAGDHARAFDELTALVSEFPRRTWPRYQRARAAVALGDWRTARHDLRIALNIDPKHTAARTLLDSISAG